MKKNQSSRLMLAAMSGLVGAALTIGTPNANASDTKAAAKKSSTEMGKCHGVNACKGKGDCGTKTHSCHGKNACKGKGWSKLDQEHCKEKGGKWEKLS